MNNKKPFVLILAGGSGTRLWPLSTHSKPKQLLALYSKLSLIDETIQRALQITSIENIYIGTNSQLKKHIKKQSKSLKNKNFIIEPEGKNTAPIIALFCAQLKHEKKESNAVIVLSADHFIEPVEKWVAAVNQTIPYANERIWCMGIQPLRADTGYGYIQQGTALEQEGLFTIAAFKEKPDEKTAELYLAEKSYLWNSGMFIFSSKLFLKELESHANDVFTLANKAIKNKKALKKYFSQMPKISVDYAILEKSEKLGVVSASFTWDDVGSFETVTRIRQADKNKNFISHGTTYQGLESKNNILYTDNFKAVALLGVSDLIIAEENGVLLVAHRQHIDDIKKLREKFDESLH